MVISVSQLRNTNLMYIKGVGQHKADVLADQLHIQNVFDMLSHYPYRHIDRRKIYRIHEINSSHNWVQVKGVIRSLETVGEGRSRRLVAYFSDGNETIELVWFNGIKFFQRSLKIGVEYIAFGQPKAYSGCYNITHPELTLYNEHTFSNLGMMPMYHTTDKMKRNYLSSTDCRDIIRGLFLTYGRVFEETLPQWIIDTYHLIPLGDALYNIHFPESAPMYEKAVFRLKFEELFYIQLNLVRYMIERRQTHQSYSFTTPGHFFLDFYHDRLPFNLTGAQKRVVKEIYKDMNTGVQMNRLLQGDVGSGKTLVALMAMLIVAGSGFQACLMAPTEILAQQHLKSIRDMLGDLPVHVELLTGSIKGKKRKKLLEDLEKGDIHILIGTHALIEKWVVFNRLGMVVIDEQHRFGVEQRARLWEKSERPPHILVMTATPIPRTLAMTIYGDLQTSVIDELPPGRKPITTIHKFSDHRTSLYMSVDKQLAQGRQVYIVYPLIQESEKSDLEAVESGYLSITQRFEKYKVCMVHGKMKSAEKEAQMRLFSINEAQIMVATTVIEVGVNVPNASVMIIENADRFGLSQLHQLRGRVGRGAEKSFCVLVTSPEINETTRNRVDIMVKSNNGFDIAEADLKFRGPGDLSGTIQSGQAFNLKIADVAHDGQLVEECRNLAMRIADADPQCALPENQIMWQNLKVIRKQQRDWGQIS